MPTVKIIDGFRFFFYSNEEKEPPHIHVEKGSGIGKWWLSPTRCAWSRGLGWAGARKADRILRDHEREFLEAWHEHFGE